MQPGLAFCLVLPSERPMGRSCYLELLFKEARPGGANPTGISMTEGRVRKDCGRSGYRDAGNKESVPTSGNLEQEMLV